jgi:hypothetical protein
MSSPEEKYISKDEGNAITNYELKITNYGGRRQRHGM